MLLNGLEIISKTRVAVLLAGGQSRRMGEDKALLPFGGISSLAEFQYQRLQDLFDRVYIASKVNKFSFDALWIKEKNPSFSPLVALVSMWESLDEDVMEVFVLSVDTPFISSEIIRILSEKALSAHTDAIVARSEQGLQPLCAIYRRSSFKTMERLLSQNTHKLHFLLQNLTVEEVYFKEEKLFMNVNYPHDYQEAQEYLKRLI